MINYKDNFILGFLEKKAIRGFSSSASIIFYDKRIKEVFRKQLSENTKPIKYYFTDTTMKRVNQMDLANCHPTKLGYLHEKYPNELGICICKEDNIGFIYQIGINDIKLIITSGTKRSGNTSIDKFGKVDYSAYLKTIVGSAIISFDTDTPEFMPNNTLSFVICKYDTKVINNSDKLEIVKIAKHLKRLGNAEYNLSDIPKSADPYLYNLVEDVSIKNAKIWKAIKMFIFLKTAQVVEKTFVSDNKNGLKNSSEQNKNEGIIIVDSAWDSSINVINPFSVSGHFREQPKKNEKREWYKEVIYIDSFMKHGYNRRAKINTAQQSSENDVN